MEATVIFHEHGTIAAIVKNVGTEEEWEALRQYFRHGEMRHGVVFESPEDLIAELKSAESEALQTKMKTEHAYPPEERPGQPRKYWQNFG